MSVYSILLINMFFVIEQNACERTSFWWMANRSTSLRMTVVIVKCGLSPSLCLPVHLPPCFPVQSVLPHWINLRKTSRHQSHQRDVALRNILLKLIHIVQGHSHHFQARHNTVKDIWLQRKPDAEIKIWWLPTICLLLFVQALFPEGMWNELIDSFFFPLQMSGLSGVRMPGCWKVLPTHMIQITCTFCIITTKLSIRP